MASWGLVVALMCVGCGAVRKPPEPNRHLEVEMSGSLFEAPNGYRFAVLPQPGTDVLRIDVRYPVGSADDPPGKEGLAHLVEHLTFASVFSRDGKPTTITAELGRVAIAWNAATYRDYTTYQTLIARSELDEVMRIEVMRLAAGCAGLTKDIVAREREVVINELRQNAGVSGADVARAIDEQAYPVGHPYRRVDSIASVSGLTLDDVCGFLAGPYVRGKAFVIASGKIDGPGLQDAAGKYFGGLPTRDLTTRAVPVVAPPNPGSVKLSADVDEPTLVMLWSLPARASKDYRLLEMAMPAIADRLESFALTYGWGHGATSAILGGDHAPVLAVSVTLDAPVVTSEIRDAVERATQFAIRSVFRPGDDQGTSNWKRLWQARAEAVLARWDSLDSRNQMFGDFLQYDADEGFLVGRIAELTKATPREAHQVAETWLAGTRARFVLLVPSGNPGSAAQLTYAGGAAAHATVVDGARADKPLELPTTNLAIDAETYQLDNGLKIVLWAHGDAPIVHGRLVVDSGSAHEPAGREGLASFVGADLVFPDHLVFDDREIATRVDELVERLGYELRAPGYELSDELKRAIRGQLAQPRVRERAVYDLALASALYGPAHPYARPALTEASLAGMAHDTIMGWARVHLVARNTTLILTGKFDPAIVKRHVAYNLDQVAGGDDSSDLTTRARSSPGFIAGVASKPQLTVELDAAYVRGAGFDRDHAKRVVLAEVLSSQLDGLRSKDALTYGFAASYSPRIGGGLWQIGGAADAARAAEAATALVEVIATMRRDPETYRAAFALGRRKALERLLVGERSSVAIAERLALMARFDLPKNYFDALAAAIANLTLAEFHGFVGRELDPAGQVFGAFGNQEHVDEALAAARRASP